MKNTCKIYEENGIRYQFDSKKLLMEINQKKHNQQMKDTKITKASIMEELADRLFVSTDAIKNWMYGYNGPSELEQVKSLAEYFDIDYHQLLKTEEKQMETTLERTLTSTNEVQQTITKACIRQIYQGIVGFIDNARSYYIHFDSEFDEGISESYAERAQLANDDLRERFDGILSNLENSMLDIPQDYYNELHDYIWTRLEDLIDVAADTTISIDSSKEELKDAYDYRDAMFLNWSKFFDSGYKNELKELFADYMVK